ncbi:hypothetical protein [Paenibacillus sp. UMB4589-SE434]|uniref:hypothetical protein n=1 Tax=Paenibacillus sp. UMB4589-SE434 TaxID=3046314 RepID=UPI00254E21C1|nr:hypothetical protein [Paenibacillus sp. UMB4589-SE434]MDK8181638.1 hypothetical protein [Paenibacillus sp. UMB4589-SE434]
MPEANMIPDEVIKQLSQLYQKIMLDPCFDRYEEHQEEFDFCYSCLEGLQLNEQQKSDLAALSDLHSQLIRVILLEQLSVREDMNLHERKKQVSNKYSKLSVYDGTESYFLDQKR